MSARELGDPAMTWVDNFLAMAVEHSLEHLDSLIVYPHVSSQALEGLIPKLSLTSLDLLAMDFRRLAATPELAFLLHGAPNGNAALKAKVEEWAQRQGIPLNEFIEVAPPVVHLSEADDSEIEIEISIDEEQADDDALPEEAEAFLEEDELEGTARQIPLARLLREMSAAQKIALALKGNREARTALIRDSNRMISASVLKILESPTARYPRSQNRASSDEVIRLICANRDAVKNYQIRHAWWHIPRRHSKLRFGL